MPQGFILSKHQFEKAQQTYLEIWCATEQGAVQLITDAQQFIFFLRQQDVEPAQQVLTDNNINFTTKPLSLTDFQHRPCQGFYFSRQRSFQEAKAVLAVQQIECLEADIKLADRYLMERFVYGSCEFTGIANGNQITGARLKPSDYQPKLNVLSLDVECSEKGALYSIGLATATEQCVLMIGSAEPDSPSWIQWVNDEKHLLQQFVSQFSKLDPDVVVGWSVVNFDFRLMLKRAELHQVPLTVGRYGQNIAWRELSRSGQGFVHMPGRTIIDGIDALKSATWQFDSYSLEFVAQSLLGKGKKVEDVSNRMEHINHDFHHNKQKLAEYNLQDCVLVLEIFDTTSLLDFLLLRGQLTGLELDRAGGSVAAFTNLYLPKLHRAGYIAPNLPPDGGLASPGGYVMNSKPGLYRNVLVLDFKSLYPSIIRTFKVDPLGLIEGLKSPDNAIAGFKGAQFSRDKHFLPDIITQLWAQRDEAKRRKDAARSQAIKILMNSFYGVLGSGGCRFYDTRLASSITMRGHEIMQTSAGWIEAQGHQVIYGDTDSTFVWLGNDVNVSEAFAIGESLAAEINQKWQQQLLDRYNIDCYLELEFETYFSQFLMPTIRGSELGSKKRYAGIKQDKNGTHEQLIFKGMETVRSDWTPLAKEFQTELYRRVFAGEDVAEFVLQQVQCTLSGKHDDKLVYRKRLRQKLEKYQKNVPPHVKAARFADSINKNAGRPLQYQNKGWIKYVITVNGPEAIEYQQSPLDHQHYVEKQLRPVADAILPFVNLSFEQVTSAQLGLF
ncbi:MAG: DNA polymerase II [Aestuariibacter sp.]